MKAQISDVIQGRRRNSALALCDGVDHLPLRHGFWVSSFEVAAATSWSENVLIGELVRLPLSGRYAIVRRRGCSWGLTGVPQPSGNRETNVRDEQVSLRHTSVDTSRDRRESGRKGDSTLDVATR